MSEEQFGTTSNMTYGCETVAAHLRERPPPAANIVSQSHYCIRGSGKARCASDPAFNRQQRQARAQAGAVLYCAHLLPVARALHRLAIEFAWLRVRGCCNEIDQTNFRVMCTNVRRPQNSVCALLRLGDQLIVHCIRVHRVAGKLVDVGDGTNPTQRTNQLV